MHLDKYLKLSDYTSPKNPYTGMEDRKFHLTHSIIGLMTELAELMEANEPVNVAEELGDLCWYAAIPLRWLGYTAYPTIIIDRKKCGIRDICISMGAYGDFIKRDFAWIQGPDLTAFQKATEALWSALYSYADAEDIPMDVVFDANIAKLEARFPNKFELEKGITRNLAGERKILEKYFAKAK